MIISAREFQRRHEFCITEREYRQDCARMRKEYGFIPKNFKRVCDHPEDRICGGEISPDQLEELNMRLGNKRQLTPGEPEKNAVLQELLAVGGPLDFEVM